MRERDTGLMDEKIIELYEKYENCREVAQALGVCSETVRRVLVKHGVPRTHRHPKERKTDLRMPSNCRTKYCGALVVMLRVTLGMPTHDISQETGIPSNSVVNIFNRKRPDLKLNRNQRVTATTIDAIERDYMTGATTAELGDKYGLNRATISSLMIKRGHYRGKGDKLGNKRRHDEAVARFMDEYGETAETNGARHEARRYYRMNSRPRDYGITWKAIARKNGSMRCEMCGIECDPDDKAWGSSGPTHPSVDHIVEISKGGTDTCDNVRLACVCCNISRNKVAANV